MICSRRRRAGIGRLQRSRFEQRVDAVAGAVQRTEHVGDRAGPDGELLALAYQFDRADVEVGAPHFEVAERQASGRGVVTPDAERERVLVREDERAARPQDACTWRKRRSTSSQLRQEAGAEREVDRVGAEEREGRRSRSRATRREFPALRPAPVPTRAAPASGRVRWCARPTARTRPVYPPQPSSRTRLPLRSPHSRRSASFGRSRPYCTVRSAVASPRRAVMRSHVSVFTPAF